jgi:hypothetical protein
VITLVYFGLALVLAILDSFFNAFTCYTGLFLRIQPAAEAGEASGGLKTA